MIIFLFFEESFTFGKFAAVLLFIQPLVAMSSSTTEEQNGEYVEEDVWFGPGFYYGIWFDDEDDYWEWRQGHREYPPNHGYYHHDHPIHYHSEEGHHGGGHSGGGHK